MRTFIFLILVCFSHFAHAAKKALVIGNNQYSQSSISSLTNAVNAANTIAETLNKIGFHVTLKTNLDHQDFKHSIQQFSDSLTTDDIVFVYYSGHSVATNGNSYLLPVEFNISDLQNLQFHSVNAQEALYSLTKNGAHVVLVLDTNQSDPFSSRHQSYSGRPAPVQQDSGSSYVFYSTSYGEDSLDDGFFARTLAKALLEPQSLDSIRVTVSKAVRKHSHGKQNPYVTNKLSIPNEKFYLADPKR